MLSLFFSFAQLYLIYDLQLITKDFSFRHRLRERFVPWEPQTELATLDFWSWRRASQAPLQSWLILSFLFFTRKIFSDLLAWEAPHENWNCFKLSRKIEKKIWKLLKITVTALCAGCFRGVGSAFCVKLRGFSVKNFLTFEVYFVLVLIEFERK